MGDAGRPAGGGGQGGGVVVVMATLDGSTGVNLAGGALERRGNVEHRDPVGRASAEEPD